MHIAIATDLYENARRHLDEAPERVCFLLGDWDGDQRQLVLHTWRSVGPDGVEFNRDLHVSLTDETQAAVIRWAWDAGGCLVEAHSHRPQALARFSPSDLWGLDQWVHHLWWRLRRRPYAALVMAGDTFDGLAWVSSPKVAEQVRAIVVNGRSLPATGRTLRELTMPREDRIDGA